jgi:hypothetical protein
MFELIDIRYDIEDGLYYLTMIPNAIIGEAFPDKTKVALTLSDLTNLKNAIYVVTNGE